MDSSRLFGMWYHPLYTDGIHPEARSQRPLQLLLDRFEASGARESMHITQPQPVAKSLLLLAHDVDYVDRFLAGELSEKEKSGSAWPVDAGDDWTHAGPHRWCGGGDRTRRSPRWFRATWPAGPTTLTDFGRAACSTTWPCAHLHALENLGVERVAVVDLDVHQGDGTATILANEPRACDFGSLFDQLPLPKIRQRPRPPRAPRISDDVYLNTVREALDICEAFKPDLIL